MGFIKKTGDSNTRSFRIDKALEAELELEAHNQNKSVSSIIEKVIEDYLNHYRYLNERKALTILPETMNAFLDYLDEDALVKIGEYVGGNIPRQTYLMKGVPYDEKTALNHLKKILGEHDNWFKISYHEYRRPYLYIQNQLGSKWIIFVEAYIQAFYTSLGIEIECLRVGDNLQVIF